MSFKRLLPILVIILSLTLSGCVLPASKAAVPSATPTSLVPFPVATLPNIATAAPQATPKVNVATQDVPLPTQQAPIDSTAIVVVETPKPTKTPYVLPTLDRPDNYTLKQGEWPLCIARRYNLEISSFLAANGLTLDSKPAEGAVLKITSSGAWNSGPRSLINHPDTYTVSSGETIYSIACAYGDVDPMAIVAANGLASPYTLKAGQTLQIP